MKRLTSSILAFGVAIAFAVPAAAQADAQRFLQQKHEAVSRVMERNASTSRDAQLGRLISELLDYQELSRRALGEHWEAQDEVKRAEFVTLLEQLIERSYRQNLQRTLRFEVDYGSAEARGDDALVHTEARSRTNRRAPPVAIDYLLRRHGRGWRVVDLTVDHGLSMVESYRRQFDRIIARDGWDGLIERMRSRLES